MPLPSITMIAGLSSEFVRDDRLAHDRQLHLHADNASEVGPPTRKWDF